MAFTSAVFSICIFYITGTSSNTYSQSLTPSNLNTDGISVITSDSEVHTNSDGWRVIIKSQKTWQFIIDLGDQFTFDPVDKSTIKFTINSPLPSNDLLFGFSNGNDKYVSTWIPMNNNGRKNHIHPQCDVSNSPTTAFAKGDISRLPQSNRHCDIAPGNGYHGCKWDTWQPKNAQYPTVYHLNGFPITFTFSNYPTDDVFTIHYKSADFEPEFMQMCGFTSFDASKSFKIYIAGGEIGDSFTVSSFDIEYDGTKSFKTQDTPSIPIPADNKWRMIVPDDYKTDIKKAEANSVVYSSDTAKAIQVEIAENNKGSTGVVASVVVVVCVIGLCMFWLNRYCLNEYGHSKFNGQKSDNTDSESGSLSSLSRTLSDPDGYEQDSEIDTDSLDDIEHEYKYEYEFDEEVEDEMVVENVLTLEACDSVRVNHERANAMSHLSPSDDIIDNNEQDKYSQDSMISDVNEDVMSGEKEHEHIGNMIEKEIVEKEKSHKRIDSGIPQFDENEDMDIPNDLLGDMVGALM